MQVRRQLRMISAYDICSMYKLTTEQNLVFKRLPLGNPLTSQRIFILSSDERTRLIRRLFCPALQLAIGVL